MSMRSSFKRFLAIMHARNLEFVRDKSAFGWNLMMPVFLVIGFVFLFSGKSDHEYKIALYGVKDGQKIEEVDTINHFFNTKYILFIKVKNLPAALKKVKQHQIDMLIDVNKPFRYWINSDSKKGYVLERMLWGSQTILANRSLFVKQSVSGREIGYVEWVLPGILAMNMMFSCLFGIGYVIVRYRKFGVLKRFKATPLTAFEFLTAQVISRLTLILGITLVIFAGCHLIPDFKVLGSYISLFVVFVLGSLCMISLAMIVAASTTSEEFANGILNLVSWPMLIFSGVWFSLEGLHPWAQNFSQLLPLTHLIEAFREIMNNGASLIDVGDHLLIMTLMTVSFIAIGSWFFKWER